MQLSQRTSDQLILEPFRSITVPKSTVHSMQLSQYKADQDKLAPYRSTRVNKSVVTLVEIGPYLTSMANPLRIARNLLTILKADAEGYAPLDLIPGEGLESYISLATDFAGTSTTPALQKRNYLLLLIVLDDQYMDRKADATIGKHNYFEGMSDSEAQSTWQTLRSTWTQAAQSITAPELDSVVSTESILSVRGVWSG